MRKPNDSCTVCKTELYRRPQDKTKFPRGYCSNHKNQAYKEAAIQRVKAKYHTYIQKWKLGLVNGMRGKTAISAHIRKYLFEKSGNKCSKCGWSKINPSTGKRPLEVNHIDGDFRNNKEKNLELICPNCHALTHSFRSLNKGNGRPRKY